MKRSILLEFLVLLLLVMNAWALWDNANLKVALEKKDTELKTYAIINGKNLARKYKTKELKDIVEACELLPAPIGCVWALRQWENGIPYHCYGVMRYFEEFQNKEQKQLYSCIKIVQQVEAEYVSDPKHRKDFIDLLAKRYNRNYDKIVPSALLKMWEEYDREGR